MVQVIENGRTQVVSLNPQNRRRENRRSAQSRAMLTVLDGSFEGSQFEVTTRDVSCSGISFLLREALAVGQTCRLDLPNQGGLVSYLCEIVRSRAISNGRHEMALQYRKAV